MERASLRRDKKIEFEDGLVFSESNLSNSNDEFHSDLIASFEIIKNTKFPELFTKLPFIFLINQVNHVIRI